MKVRLPVYLVILTMNVCCAWQLFGHHPSPGAEPYLSLSQYPGLFIAFFVFPGVHNGDPFTFTCSAAFGTTIAYVFVIETAVLLFRRRSGKHA
jgi:hypothetical protein